MRSGRWRGGPSAPANRTGSGPSAPTRLTHAASRAAETEAASSLEAALGAPSGSVTGLSGACRTWQQPLLPETAWHFEDFVSQHELPARGWQLAHTAVGIKRTARSNARARVTGMSIHDTADAVRAYISPVVELEQERFYASDGPIDPR